MKNEEIEKRLTNIYDRAIDGGFLEVALKAINSIMCLKTAQRYTDSLGTVIPIENEN